MGYKMICEICGNKYRSSCPHCSRRIETWGYNGALELYELAKRKDDIKAEELLSFVYAYYQGEITNKREAVGVLKTGLRLLGYTGKFDRIHLYSDYDHVRFREHQKGKRWRLRKDNCERCNGVDELKLHHIIPVSWGGKTSDDNCVTLCKKCHGDVHKQLKKYLNRERLIGYLKPHFEEIEKYSKLSMENE